MHEQENLKTIDQVYAAFGEGDIEGVLGMLTNDVQWTSPGPSDVITYASSRTGDEQVAGYVEARCEAVETTMLRPQRFFAQDALVVVLERYTLRVVMTGTVIYNDWVRTFELADGKILALEGKLAVTSHRLGRHALILIGGAPLTSGYAAGAVDRHLPPSRPYSSRGASPLCILAADRPFR